jgi:hypothetical protein
MGAKPGGLGEAERLGGRLAHGAALNVGPGPIEESLASEDSVVGTAPPFAFAYLVPTTESGRAEGEADWVTPLLSLPFPIARRKALEEFERRYVTTAVAAHGGNVSAAARASGLALRYFRLVRARQSGA